MPHAPLDDRARRILSVAEKLGVALLLVAALVPRLRDLNGPWDREYDGFQGTFFFLTALNYERLGFGAHGGYPTLNIDLPTDPDERPFLYPNHPPLVPLAAWMGLKVLGPEGWDQNWRTGQPPPAGSERATRIPFLVAHMLGLLALWWAVRCAGNARTALLALAVAAVLPIQVVYGYLVNYENLVWPPMLLGVAFQLRYLCSERTRALLAAGASLFAAACVTFFAAFLVPPLVLQAWVSRGFRSAWKTGAVLSVSTLAPALAHGAWARHALADAPVGNLADRVKLMLAPLFDGTLPLWDWIRLQLLRMEHFFTLPILILALVGLGVVGARSLSKRNTKGLPWLSPGPVLLIAGITILLAFYQHTGDGRGVFDGQTVFLLHLAPGIAVLAAEALSALGRPLLRLGGGEGPLVVVTLAFLLPALVRAESIRQRWRDPGPLDQGPVASGPPIPLPSTVGAQVHDILPPGAIGIYPSELSLTPAASYYAWRTLLPATPESYDQALLLIEKAYGMKDAPRYILIPKQPPPAAREGTARSRAIVSALSEMIAATEQWELWPPIPDSPAQVDGTGESNSEPDR